MSVAWPLGHQGRLDHSQARSLLPVNARNEATCESSDRRLMTNPEEAVAPAGDSQAEEPGVLSVVAQELPEATIVTVSGDVDLLSAPELSVALDSILSATDGPVAVDLNETTFMDSTGIHALVNASNRARQHFAVICGPGTVRRTIDLLGLTEPLCVVESLEEYLRRRAAS